MVTYANFENTVRFRLRASWNKRQTDERRDSLSSEAAGRPHRAAAHVATRNQFIELREAKISGFFQNAEHRLSDRADYPLDWLSYAKTRGQSIKSLANFDLTL